MRHIRAITKKTAHCLRSKANAALLAGKKKSVLVLSSNTGLYHYLILLV